MNLKSGTYQIKREEGQQLSYTNHNTMCSKRHSFIAQLSSRVQEVYFFTSKLCFCLVSDELTAHKNSATHWDNKYKNR